jgi:hypothetical protein
MKRDRISEDALPSSQIKMIVDDIVAHTGSVADRKRVFSKKYPEFVDRYPALFGTACEPGFDYNRFLYMMGMLDKVTTRQSTLDDASKEVGQALFDQYVAPVINEKSETQSTS